MSALDRDQQRAVEVPDGPLLILAGAGSGKTRVLIDRAATLIGRETAVLAITFTNASARELRDRLGQVLEANALEQLTVGTFHAICHRIVRADPQRVGRTPRFSVYDANASRRMVAAAVRRGDMQAELAASLVADQITRAKAHLVDPAGYAELARSPRAERIAEAYAHYEAALADSDALDFDDLLIGALAVLGDPVLLDRYRRRWRAILVDEYQDTNPAQEAWLARLAGERPNLTTVGDPEQAIYGFREADVAHILGFEHRYPPARVVALSRNYRSTGAIVECAARLAGHGSGDPRVRMWTGVPEGEPVTAHAADDERDEAQQIAIWCRHLLDTGDVAGELAVLVRTRAQARVTEDALVACGVPYRLLGAGGLWDVAAVRDLVAHLALLANPRDQAALTRALASQPGVGPVAVARVLGAAPEHGGDLLATCAAAAQIPRLSGSQRQGVGAFGQTLRAVSCELERRSVAATVRDTVVGCGLADRLRRRSGDQSDEQLEALRRVCRAASAYERDSARPTLSEFLAAGALDDEPDDDGEGRVTVCTLHAAKGAEWDHVWMAGLCEGLLPHQRAIARGQVDEERRLAYVGITRARRQLRLTWPRLLHGRPTRRSRFIDEAGLTPAARAREDEVVRDRAA